MIFFFFWGGGGGGGAGGDNDAKIRNNMEVYPKVLPLIGAIHI